MVGQDVVTIEVRQLDAELPLPDYAHKGDAGADLRARTDVTIAPGGGRALVPTGVAVAIPEGYAGFVQPRSGLALRHGVTVLNAPGLIDAGYRDELRVLLVNTDPVTPYEVRRGDRVAQLVVKAVAQAEFVAVDELPGSERGTRRLRPHRPVGESRTVPELPEVEALALFVTERAGGATIERAELGSFSALKTYDPPIEALVGRTVAGAERRGKYLCIDTSGDLAGGPPGQGRVAALARARAPGARSARERPASPCGLGCPTGPASTSPSRARRNGWPCGW